MKTRTALALLASAAMLPLMAQTANAGVDPTAKPMFAFPKTHVQGKHFPASLQVWSGSFNYNNQTHNFRMVGTDPHNTNTTTTITAYIVPIKMKYTKALYGSSHHTFDPMKDTWNGDTVMNQFVNSPLFDNLDWKWGSTDVGTTQYTDAYQRGSFWGPINGGNTAYHVVLAPTVLAEVTIKPTTAQGGKVVGNPFGGTGKVGEMNINSFDSKLQSFITQYSQINPTNVPIFVTDNIYLTSGGCCIGGYHNANGNGQTYMTATFAYSSVFVFSNDISAFSHEIAEWYADPLINNTNECGGLLEVGDPMEGKANYGDFPVVDHGVTYDPQAEVFISYFGDSVDGSANGWLDNQHIESSVCQNGQ